MEDAIAGGLEHAPCGFIVFADTGVITAINETLVTLLGYGCKSELLGKNIESLLGIAGRIFYQTHFFPLLMLHGKANEIFFSLKTKERSSLHVMCNAVRKEHDGVGFSHCIFMPVTERQKYEQELLDARSRAERALAENEELIEAKRELETHTIELDRQLSRLTRVNEDISQFSKVISHDLQESIRKLAIFSDMVSAAAGAVLPPEGLINLAKINAECVRLRELAADIDRFMSLSIITEEIKGLDMNYILEYAAAQVKEQFKNASFHLEAVPVIEGFEKQMKLLFCNIFSYCTESLAADGLLSVSVECSVVQQNAFRAIKEKYRYIDFAKIVITDSGARHCPADGSVFKLQRQPGKKHINFALPFCKKIVDNHHGDIQIVAKAGSSPETIIMLPLVHT